MKIKLLLLTLIMIAVVAAGCARLGTATDEIGTCPEPASETALLENETLGYCLLYPDEYIVEMRENNDILVIESIMNHIDPRFDVLVEDAQGRSAADAADEMVKGLPAGMDVVLSTIKLDGQEAVVVDNYPAQDISRFLFVVHGDHLYRLMFTHTAPDLGDAYTRAENLYTLVVNSFRFLDAA